MLFLYPVPHDHRPALMLEQLGAGGRAFEDYQAVRDQAGADAERAGSMARHGQYLLTN